LIVDPNVTIAHVTLQRIVWLQIHPWSLDIFQLWGRKRFFAQVRIATNPQDALGVGILFLILAKISMAGPHRPTQEVLKDTVLSRIECLFADYRH
jgi:hypothetical protein